MGGMSRHTQAASFPPSGFHCLLDELPVHLIPKQARGLLSERVENPAELILNPDCDVRAADDIPAEIQLSPEGRAAFAPQGSIAWVRDECGSLLPFWLGTKLEALVRELRHGQTLPPEAPRDLIALLVAGGILTTSNASVTHQRGRHRLQESNVLFQKRGYTPLPALLHPFHVASLRRYYRSLIRTGKIQLGDAQSSLRYVAHNEPVASFFHHQLTPVFSAVAGEPLKPSYVYLASYLSGADLKKHTDREQCEFSITLCLDFSPEPELATPWPLRLQTSNGETAVYQSLGDGLAYRGTQLPHFRSPLAPGHTSTSIFFHFVRADFEGPLA